MLSFREEVGPGSVGRPCARVMSTAGDGQENDLPSALLSQIIHLSTKGRDNLLWPHQESNTKYNDGIRTPDRASHAPHLDRTSSATDFGIHSSW